MQKFVNVEFGKHFLMCWDFIGVPSQLGISKKRTQHSNQNKWKVVMRRVKKMHYIKRIFFFIFVTTQNKIEPKETTEIVTVLTFNVIVLAQFGFGLFK